MRIAVIISSRMRIFFNKHFSLHKQQWPLKTKSKALSKKIFMHDHFGEGCVDLEVIVSGEAQLYRALNRYSLSLSILLDVNHSLIIWKVYFVYSNFTSIHIKSVQSVICSNLDRRPLPSGSCLPAVAASPAARAFIFLSCPMLYRANRLFRVNHS